MARARIVVVALEGVLMVDGDGAEDPFLMEANDAVALTINALAARGRRVHVLSVRPESERARVEQWLHASLVRYYRLHMKDDDDESLETDYKRRVVSRRINKSQILYVLDSRMNNIRMFSRLGLLSLLVVNKLRNTYG